MIKNLFQATIIGLFAISCTQQVETTDNSKQVATEVQQKEPYTGKLMVGFPPSKESQVTFANYRTHPFMEWGFRNAGAPLNVLMIPRSGKIYELEEKYDDKIKNLLVTDANKEQKTVHQIFKENFGDGILVLKDNDILYEAYWNGLNKDYQHIWFSATKSFTSTAFGILVHEGKVKLSDSPVKYIPELKGSGFERVTLRNVLNHSTSIDFKENYTDPESDFLKYYGPAMNMAKVPGGRDIGPYDTEIYGVHDFLAKFIQPNEEETPGEVFDYNSANSDLLGWVIAKVSGMSYNEFVHKYIWSKLGAEHDAYIAVDRAYMPVTTGGMNSTLRDAARFGNMILNRGYYNGQQIIPADWVDASTELTEKDKQKMADNEKYEEESWLAYKNMWWILNDKIGEYCAVGIHGQVIYINREAGVVITWFSSQPTASAAKYNPFRSKLLACQEIAKELQKSK